MAMPGLGDPRFDHAVIFICTHDEKGAMGLMVNTPIEGVNFKDLLKQLKIDADDKDAADILKSPVMNGGPVETQRGFMLHSNDFSDEGSIVINNDFTVTGTIDGLKSVAKGEGPKKMVFTLGYAGWSPGQLDQEIQKNAWLTVEADKEIVFDTALDKKWERALGKIGIDPGMLSASSGQA